MAFSLRKGKLALVLVVTLGLFIVSLLLAVAGLAGPGSVRAWEMGGIGVAGIVLFAPGTILVAARLFSRAPGLVIDQDGIDDRTSYSSVGRVPWSQIAWVQVQSFDLPTFRRSLVFRSPRPRIMVIGVRDAEQFRRRGNRVQRFLRRGSVGMFGSPVAISDSALRADLDDVARWIRAGVSVA